MDINSREYLLFFQKGTNDAFPILLSNYFHDWVNYTVKQLGNYLSAEIVVLSSISSLWEIKHNIQSLDNIKAYVLSSITSLCNNYLSNSLIDAEQIDYFHQYPKRFSGKIAEELLLYLWSGIIYLNLTKRQIFILHFIVEIPMLKIAKLFNAKEEYISNILLDSTSDLKRMKETN